MSFERLLNKFTAFLRIIIYSKWFSFTFKCLKEWIVTEKKGASFWSFSTCFTANDATTFAIIALDFVWEHLNLWLKTDYNYSYGALQKVKTTTVGYWLKRYCSLLVLVVVFHFTKSFKPQTNVLFSSMLCFLQYFFSFLSSSKYQDALRVKYKVVNQQVCILSFHLTPDERESWRLMLSLIEHFIFDLVVLMIIDIFTTIHVSHRPHIHLRRMSKKPGEDLNNSWYSFTTLTSLPISNSANTRTKTKIIKMNLITVVEGWGQAALF
jgi:hypothetical protein